MHLRLTPSRMLDLWMLHSGYSPSLTDATFRRNDGIDTSAIHLAEMKQWYRRLLLEAPASCLVADDLSKSVILSPMSDGAAVIDLPLSVVRIVKVRLDSWLTSARIITSPTHPAAMRQLHPYTRATPSRPVAIFHDNRLRLYPAAASGESISTLLCVSYDEDDYRLDDSAFATIHPHPV